MPEVSNGKALDRSTASELIPVVYDELKRLAASYMQGERLDHTLQPTALANEAYLRLVNAKGIEWRGRAEFLSLAARQIRKVLVDHARRHGAQKRGRGVRKTPLVDTPDDVVAPVDDLMELDEALDELAALHERQSRIVELRFFAGMSVAEVADVLGVSEGTIKGDWTTARAWLRQRVSR